MNCNDASNNAAPKQTKTGHLSPPVSTSGAGMDGVYAAVPLKTSTHANIRLLRLCEPPRDRILHHAIACKVDVYPANTRVQYTAVSYMWGSSIETRDVLVNDCPFPVTLNLFGILKELTASAQKGLLWIDAICIDQSSIAERNHQVALMDQIFSRAHYVFVWLGLPTENMKKAYSVFMDRQISRNLRKLEETDGILEICEHPHWNRAWIVQEFVLAPSIQICFGSYRIPLLRFDKVVNHANYKASVIQQSRALAVLEMRANWQHPKRSYYDPILSIDMPDCADPRDRIFAMISLMNPRNRIKADYGLTKLQLFDKIVGAQNLNIEATTRISNKLDLTHADRWRCSQPAWRRGRVSFGSDFESEDCYGADKGRSARANGIHLARELSQDTLSKIEKFKADTKAPWEQDDWFTPRRDLEMSQPVQRLPDIELLGPCPDMSRHTKYTKPLLVTPRREFGMSQPVQRLPGIPPFEYDESDTSEHSKYTYALGDLARPTRTDLGYELG